MSESQIPVLQEHQSPSDVPSSTSALEHTPTTEERKTLKLVQNLFEKHKKHRKKYDEKWLDYYRMFRGKQWKEQRPSYRHSEVVNMIFQTIQSAVPILSDSRPKFDFLPQEPQDMEFAQILSEIAESDWTKYNWNMVVLDVLLEGHLYGTGLASCEFDGDLEFGKGAIDIKSEDVFYNYPDPNAIDCNKNCRVWVKAEPVDVEVLKREYPDKSKNIKPDLMDLSQGDKTVLDKVSFKSPVEQKMIMEGSSPYDLGNTDKTIKITVWMDSDEMEKGDEPQLDEMGQPVIDPLTGMPSLQIVEKKKYPNGRKICVANNTVLFDGPAPYDDGKKPFAKFVNYNLPREFWGISEVEQLESPQKIFNKLLSFALDVLTITGNPIWVVDSTSGIDTENLTNRPGLVVEKEPGSEARREQGLDINPSVFQMVDRLKTWFNDVSGINDVSRGAKPEGITAASAITALQEAAQTRLRQKSRNLDAFLQDIGQLYMNRVLQFYDVPKVIRLTNNQNAQKYFKFHVEQREDGKKVAVIRDYVENAQTGQLSESLTAREYIINGDFDVKVTTGSSLPFAKDEKFNKALQLFDRQLVDQEEVLKAADYPNWEAVVQRMQESAAAQAMAAQAPVDPMAGAGGPSAMATPSAV